MSLWIPGDGTQWDLEAVTDTCEPQLIRFSTWKGLRKSPAYLFQQAWETGGGGNDIFIICAEQALASRPCRGWQLLRGSMSLIAWEILPASPVRGVCNMELTRGPPQSPACNPHQEKWMEESEHWESRNWLIWPFETDITFFSWFTSIICFYQ